MITERVLRKWRKEALQSADGCRRSPVPEVSVETSFLLDIQTRILIMTQELLDQHLLRRDK